VRSSIRPPENASGQFLTSFSPVPHPSPRTSFLDLSNRGVSLPDMADFFLSRLFYVPRVLFFIRRLPYSGSVSTSFCCGSVLQTAFNPHRFFPFRKGLFKGNCPHHLSPSLLPPFLSTLGYMRPPPSRIMMTSFQGRSCVASFLPLV